MNVLPPDTDESAVRTRLAEPEPITDAELDALAHKECEGPDCINNRLIAEFRAQREAHSEAHTFIYRLDDHRKLFVEFSAGKFESCIYSSEDGIEEAALEGRS